MLLGGKRSQPEHLLFCFNNNNYYEYHYWFMNKIKPVLLPGYRSASVTGWHADLQGDLVGKRFQVLTLWMVYPYFEYQGSVRSQVCVRRYSSRNKRTDTVILQ